MVEVNVKVKVVGIWVFLLVSVQMWKGPTTIIAGLDQSNIDGMDIYTDYTTGSTHVLYCNQTSGMICHTRLHTDGSVSPRTCVDGTYKCANEVDMHGTHDGIHLYAVFAAHRRSSSGDCALSNREACIDVYFVQSNSKGDTWEPTIAVPRIDMDDVLDRMHPNIILNPNTGRVWVAYKASNKSDTELRFVSRPPSSSLFKLPLSFMVMVMV